MVEEPKLLRVPHNFATVEEILGCAGKMKLDNVLVLSERENGNLVTLSTDMTVAQMNWLIDRMKMLLLLPEGWEKK